MGLVRYLADGYSADSGRSHERDIHYSSVHAPRLRIVLRILNENGGVGERTDKRFFLA